MSNIPLEFTDRYENKMWVFFNDDPINEVIISMKDQSYPIDNKNDLDILVSFLLEQRSKLKDT